MDVKEPRVVRRHTSYDSYASSVELKDLFHSLRSPSIEHPGPNRDWLDNISLLSSWFEENKPALRVQYADCHTRMDILSHLWDAKELKPKPYLKPVTEWPPQDYDCTFRPPKLDKLPAPFSVSSCPDFLNEAYDQMITNSKEYLDCPLSPEQLEEWIELEAERVEDVVDVTLGWLDLDDIAVQHDRVMYEPLSFFSDVIPVSADIANIHYTPLSIETDRRDWVLLADGFKKTESCLIRFLHMTYLDVCDEIQDIASQSLKTKLVDGQPQWPSLKHWTPPHGKAQSILAWVFHASRPAKTMLRGSCNYVKLSDGWRTIWFLVENGHIKVGPTMTPSTLDTNPPTQDAPFGLVHALLGCGAVAGKKHVEEISRLKAKAKAKVKHGIASTADTTANSVALASVPAFADSRHDDISQRRNSPSYERKKPWGGSSTTPPESTRQSTRARSTTVRFTSDKHKQQGLSAVSRDASSEEDDAHIKKKARRRA